MRHTQIIIFLLSIYINAISLSALALQDDPKLLKTEKEIFAVYEAMSLINQSIHKSQIDLENILLLTRQKKLLLQNRVIARQKISQIPLAPLFEEKISDFHFRMKILERLNQSDLALMNELFLSKSETQYLIDNLNKQKKTLETKLTDLKSLEQQLVAIENIITNSKTNINDKNHLLLFKGALEPPVNTKPIYSFGNQQNHQFNFNFSVKGLVYQTSKSTAVKAAGPGTIIFSDAIPYWGQSVIISHVGGYFTLYSGVHLSQFKVNDQVKIGEVFAKTNATDFYFELRHQDIPLKPNLWMKIQ